MKRIDAHEVARQVVVSLVLEPIAEKDGCTTRTIDLDETIRLQHLQVAGVNVGRYFFDLVERINKCDGQPPEYFDLAWNAVNESQKNLQNTGKYINQGLITIFFHVVLASLLTEGTGVDVCKNVPNILEKSSAFDAKFRAKSLQLVWSKSRNKTKREFPLLEAGNLSEFYKKLNHQAQVLQYESGVVWSREILSGLPTVQAMYLEAMKNLDGGFLVAIEEAYKKGVELLSINSPGFVADYTGVVGYLLVKESGDRPIIK